MVWEGERDSVNGPTPEGEVACPGGAEDVEHERATTLRNTLKINGQGRLAGKVPPCKLQLPGQNCQLFTHHRFSRHE